MHTSKQWQARSWKVHHTSIHAASTPWREEVGRQGALLATAPAMGARLEAVAVWAGGDGRHMGSISACPAYNPLGIGKRLLVLVLVLLLGRLRALDLVAAWAAEAAWLQAEALQSSCTNSYRKWRGVYMCV
eukprot:1140485-Pelagomonas_calceolata.AAC.3